MYCTNCGLRLSDTAKFCLRCGAPVKVKKVTRQPTSLNQMLIREGKARQALGETLVRVSAHGGSCPLCKPFEGKVLIDDVFSGGTIANSKKKYNKVPMKYRAHVALLSQAMQQGLFHDGCHHGLGTFYVELL